MMLSRSFRRLGLLLLAAALAGPAAAQTWQWAAQTSGTPASATASSGVQTYATAVDDAGNTYATGRYAGSARFGAITMPVPNNIWAVFVAKLSAAGQWQWAVPVDGRMYSEGQSIAVDPAGTAVYAGGALGAGTYALGPGPAIAIPAVCIHGGFVGRLSASTGQWQWAQATNNSAEVTVLVLGPGGALYAGGKCRGLNFALGGVASVGNLSAGGAFVARLATATGQGQWLNTVAGVAWGTYLRGLAVDGAGNVLATGNFDGSPRIGTTTLTNRGGQDIFLAKLNPAGAWAWATGLGSPGSDYAYQVRTDAAGNAYVAGGGNGAITAGVSALPATSDFYSLVAKCSPAGQWLWANRPGGAATQQVSGLALDGGGRLYANGVLTAAATFGATTLVPIPNANVFLAQLDPGTGQWQQAQLLPGDANWPFHSLCATPVGALHVAGVFQGAIACGPALTLTTGAQDSYFGKLTWASTATALLPVRGPVGMVVTLTGTRLEGVSRVQLGGRDAVFVRVSPTQLRLTIPAGLAAGPQALLLATPHGPLAGPGFAVTATGLAATPGAAEVAFVLYPNPAQGLVNIAAELPSAGPVTLQLFDGLGRPVQHHTLVAPAGAFRRALDVSPQAPGLYLLRLRLPDGTVRTRPVVRE